MGDCKREIDSNSEAKIYTQRERKQESDKHNNKNDLGTKVIKNSKRERQQEMQIESSKQSQGEREQKEKKLFK